MAVPCDHKQEAISNQWAFINAKYARKDVNAVQLTLWERES